jgi:tripartite-type tricarboxylate transporter receptor subunit TctC
MHFRHLWPRNAQVLRTLDCARMISPPRQTLVAQPCRSMRPRQVGVIIGAEFGSGRTLMRLTTWVLGVTLAGLSVFGAQAQTFPTRNVTILVPFAAGGPTDAIMRILGERLTARWGKSVIIENRPGAGTIVATAALAKATPDGHTLGVATNSFAINPAINHTLTYDTLKDFAGISMVVSVPIVLVANPTFPPNTVAELVALAKRTGEPLNFTSPGPRTVGHLAGAWLENLTGIKLTHIAYNGSAPALIDVLAGRVPVMFDLWSSAKPYVVDGRLKVLAVASAQRLSDAPQYPTMAETYPGFDVNAIQAIIAPKGVPAAVIEKISADIRSVVSSPEFAEKVGPLGVFPRATTPQELDAMIRKEIDRWSAIAKAANITID